MANNVRSFQIQLDMAELFETEDFGSDGDEIYVLGSLVARSPSQGIVDSQVFAKNPAFIQRFNDRRPKQQQLLPKNLYSKQLPDDTEVLITLKFVDADDEESESDSLSQAALDMLRKGFKDAADKFANGLRSNSKRSIARALAELFGTLFGLIPLLDEDDILGVDSRRFELATAESKAYPFQLKATMDDADYNWGYTVTIGAPEAVSEDVAEDRTEDTVNVQPGPRVVRPVTPQPVRPVGGAGVNRPLTPPDRETIRRSIRTQPTPIDPRTTGGN